MGAGISQSNGTATPTEEEINKLFTLPGENQPLHTGEHGLNQDFRNKFKCGALAKVTVLSPNDPDRAYVKEHLLKDTIFDDPRTDRAMGCFLGNVIGDALGAPFEFSKVRYAAKEMTLGFNDVFIWHEENYNRFKLRPGQWTDDAAMAQCLAESLLKNNGYNPKDLRLRFLLWWTMGYCNSFGYDDKRTEKNSVGLGGNISLSMEEFQTSATEFTAAGDKITSGNGSLMRNSPIPVFYSDDIAEAEEFAYKQSKTTHQGDEAAECCRLLTHIVINAFNGDGTKKVLEELPGSFSSPLYSVTCLANSVIETEHESNKELHLKDRRWNWKDAHFTYSETRRRDNAGYVGSYSMDCLAMALHCVYSTHSFTDALLKCANMRGDSDSVCAVVGQIAGAIYGLELIPKQWVSAVLKWDPNYDIPTRAYKLYKHKPLDSKENV